MALDAIKSVGTTLSNLTISKPEADIRSQLTGVNDSRYNNQVVHYRGIPYATIAKRFGKPTVVKEFPGSVTNFTSLAPRCPQISFDVRDFLQIPKTIPEDGKPDEDELRCANLNITCPLTETSTQLPVFVWIYGGSMANAYGNAQQRLGDPGPLVAQSIELGKPIILVTINYRLNIFGFGNGEDDINLSHQDHRAALDWVKLHIAKVGGDPKNVTVGGESAGAVYTHALLASGAQFERAILQSGSLYTSPPQPERAGFGLAGLIDGNLQLMEFDKGNVSGNFGPEASMTGAPVQAMVQSLKDLGITRFWLWDEPCFKDWENDARVFGKLKGLLIGDTAHEWMLWQGAFDKLSAKKIRQCFETKLNSPEVGAKLAKAYGIDKLEVDDETVRRETLHFLGDGRFCAWPPYIRKNVSTASGKVYQYYYDEPNPFQSKDNAKAGHAVDLFGLFGGYDEADGFSDEHKRVGRMMRTKWIDFVNGEEPWAPTETYALGPDGATGPADRDSGVAGQDANTRRREAAFAVIQEVGWQGVMEVSRKLTAAAAELSS